MKATVWTLAVITLALGALTAWSVSLTRGASDRFYQAAVMMEAGVFNSDWEAASEQLAAFETHWFRTRDALQLVIHHQDTDDVTSALGRLKAGVSLRDRSLAMEALADLKESCLHLYHRDALRLVNLI